MWLVGVVFLLQWRVVESRGLFIHGNAEVSDLRLVIGNKFIGSQEEDLSFSNTPFLFFDEFPLFSPAACSALNGTVGVVYIKDADYSTLDPELILIEEFAKCDSLGLIRLRVNRESLLGLSYNFYSSSCCRNKGKYIALPFLEASDEHLPAFLQSPNGTVSFSIDENRWRADLFEATWFLVIHRVGLAILNFVLIIFSFRTVYTIHKQKVLAASQRRSEIMIRLAPRLLLGAALVFLGAVLRIVYAIMGPLFSTSALTHEQHMYLINISVPIQTTVVVVTVYLFHRLTKFKNSRQSDVVFSMRAVVILCVISIVFELLSSHARAARQSFERVLAVSVIFSLLVVLVSSLAFSIHGIKFLKRVRASERMQLTAGRNAKNLQSSTRKRATRVKFAKQILWSVAFMALELIAGLMVISDTSIFLQSPLGFGTVYALYYYAFTLTAFAQLLAFTPKEPGHSRTMKISDKLADQTFKESTQGTPPLPNQKKDTEELDLENPLENTRTVSRRGAGFLASARGLGQTTTMNRESTEHDSDEELEDYGAAPQSLFDTRVVRLVGQTLTRKRRGSADETSSGKHSMGSMRRTVSRPKNSVLPRLSRNQVSNPTATGQERADLGSAPVSSNIRKTAALEDSSQHVEGSVSEFARSRRESIDRKRFKKNYSKFNRSFHPEVSTKPPHASSQRAPPRLAKAKTEFLKRDRSSLSGVLRRSRSGTTAIHGDRQSNHRGAVQE